MRAICISNEPKTLADHQQSRAALFEGAYPLAIGNTYGIVGMTIAERAFYFLVRDDSGRPCFAPAGFFALFTAPLLGGWRLGLEQGIRATGRDLWSAPSVAIWGYPELVDSPSHVQSLLELDSTALALFETYVAQADADV